MEQETKSQNLKKLQLKDYFEMLKKGWTGFSLAIILGVIAYGIKRFAGSPLADSLLIGMLMGIVIKFIIGKDEELEPGFKLAPIIFIPIGIIFYGAINLDFVQFAGIKPGLLVLLLVIVLVYFASILFLGKLLKQKNKISYLTATGSAICGASAIAITSPAVDAEPDDASISLISVFIIASLGLFILFPFISNLLNLTNETFSLLSAMTLQFTGFVKAATGGFSPELAGFALSIKAARYLGLLIAIPLFSSFIKKKFHVPWFLWAFLLAGLLFSFVKPLAEILNPSFKLLLGIFWSTAMAGIGLNADLKYLLSNDGIKAMVMAFAGFILAIIAFFIGISLISI